jgi:hypothetical protein
MRVAEGHHSVLCHDDGRVGAFEAGHRLGDGVLDRRALVRREQRGHDLRVRGAVELEPPST